MALFRIRQKEYPTRAKLYAPVSSLPTVYSPSMHQSQAEDSPTGAGFWRGLVNDVLADLRATEWIPFMLSMLFYFWTVGLVVLILCASLWLSSVTVNGNIRSACKPDGSFEVHEAMYDMWSISGFFQITMGFGKLTFTQAKVIDIVWDVVVGRFGQAFLTWYSLKAFSSYIRGAMDGTPITYDTFWTFFVRDDASFLSTVRLVWDFSTRRGLKSRVAMTFIVLSMAFVLAFPTLAGAMTGYTSNSESFVQDQMGNLIAFSQFKLLLYVIHDGWRIGQTGDYPIPWEYSPEIPGSDPLVTHDNGYTGGYGGSRRCQLSVGEQARYCYLAAEISRYVQAYGFFGINSSGNINNIESEWMNQTLAKPTLNITAFFIGDHYEYYGANWTNPWTKTQPFSNSSNAAFYNFRTNSTFSIGHVKEYGVCQPTGSYQWGFSFLQFFIVLICLLVWSFGIHLIYITTHCSLKKAHQADVPAKFRAAIELTLAMQREFDAYGDDLAKLTDKQMEHRLKMDLGGGRMELQNSTDLEDPYGFGRTMKTWVKKEKWWIALMLILSLFLAGGWLVVVLDMLFVSSLYWMVLCWTFGVYFAIAMGRTTRSRLFFTQLGLVIGLLVYVGDNLRILQLWVNRLGPKSSTEVSYLASVQ